MQLLRTEEFYKKPLHKKGCCGESQTVVTQHRQIKERQKGFEPSTLSLGS
jgi:hypothetical protein